MIRLFKLYTHGKRIEGFSLLEITDYITSRALFGTFYDNIGKRLYFSIGWINFKVNF